MKKVEIGEFMYVVNLGEKVAWTWGANKEDVLEDFSEYANPVITDETLVTKENVAYFNWFFEFFGKVATEFSEEEQEILLEEFRGLLKDIEDGIVVM